MFDRCRPFWAMVFVVSAAVPTSTEVRAQSSAVASEAAAHGGPLPAAAELKPSQFPLLLPGKDTGTKGASTAKWPEQEVSLAAARCRTLLKGLDYAAVPLQPFRDGDCGTPAPFELISIGNNPQVAFSPPVTVTCDMIVALDGWFRKDLQPSARRLLGEPITRVETMSSYSCRNAYGRSKSRLSEHGRANAVDIASFITAGGQGSTVLADWGLTARDVASQVAAARAAAQKAEAERIAAARVDSAKPDKAPSTEAVAATPSTAGVDDPAVALRPTISIGGSGISFGSGLSESIGIMSRLGGPKALPARGPADRQQFLREAHKSACRVFGTVLGPEANNAHRNHFHLDMADRTSGVFCE